MSTIPITFSETLPPYTVIGGREQLGSTGLSAVLLNRRGRFVRHHIFRDFEKAGFDTVISIETEPVHYDIDELSARFPFIRFIMIKGTISIGNQINIAVSELDSPLFFVLWNDQKIIAGGTAHRMAERLTAYEEKKSIKRLCTIPVIQSSRFETIPTLRAPALLRKKFQITTHSPAYEGLPSLYPFDGVGIYDRDRFIKLGGYDGTLKSGYWQLMDFGFRAHLWGEEISATQSLKLIYESDIHIEDDSAGTDYCRFYLKNLAPVLRGSSAFLPINRFPGHLLRTRSAGSSGFFSAWDDFSESRRWVQLNQFRWRCNPQTLASHWNMDAIGENGEN